MELHLTPVTGGRRASRHLQRLVWAQGERQHDSNGAGRNSSWRKGARVARTTGTLL